MDSEALLNANPLKHIDVQDEDAAKILFLVANPEHEAHDSQLVVDCNDCRSIEKFKLAIIHQSVAPLKNELRVKYLKLSQHVVSVPQEMSTVYSNFSDEEDQLGKEELEILIFTEVLGMLKIVVPPELQKKFERILVSKKIPVRPNAADDVNKKNTFFAYTSNKILSEICESLSVEEVYQIRHCFLQEKQHEVELLKMTGALNIAIDLEVMQTVPGLKDVVFYYIVLNMYKFNMLDRLYTHLLEFILERVKQSVPNLSQDRHNVIDAAIGKLRRYPLTHTPSGICIILVMINDREGAEKDISNVKRVFEKHFHFDVVIKMNPSQKSIKTIVTKLNASRNKFYDSLVLWFMGHGDKSNLFVKGGETIHRRTELIQPFVDIEWLKKKPKLFFIQACSNRKKRTDSTSGEIVINLNYQ